MKQYDSIAVEVHRGDIIESCHQVVAAIVDPSGRVETSYGDPNFVTYWRSSAKPFQAVPWIQDGSIAHWQWGEQELAIMCASHVGAKEHTELTLRMLMDIGLTEDHLKCDDELKAKHNCSGNHIGMLSACQFHGWDVNTYYQPDHPAQKAGLEIVKNLLDLDVGDIPIGIDGCGIAAWATSVTDAALAYARLPQLAEPIVSAMQHYPILIEGKGELDTVIMQAFPGTVSKWGGEAIGCVSLPNGLGLSAKVIDGGERALGPALVKLVARHLGLDNIPALANTHAKPVVKNDLGVKVGHLVAVLP
jgi:L-asparaginase II